MTQTDRTIRIAMNGVTGRMGYRQHLVRSILAIRDQGGVTAPDGTTIQVEPILVGRNEAKLRHIAQTHGLEEISTDIDTVMTRDDVDVYFDAQTTSRRHQALRQAIEAGKHVYTEKPTAGTLDQAIELATLARRHGIIDGVVHDKLYLPGLVKLRRLVDMGFFGRILSMRGEFGYWVWEGTDIPAQRPSWNYRKTSDGSITTDMFPHWSYVIEGLIGPIHDVYSQTATHISERVDEAGKIYTADADDAAYAIFNATTSSGDPVVVQMNSSWDTRVFREELVEFQIDGTAGSAVAGLFECVCQPRGVTPRPTWNPDLPDIHDYMSMWQRVPSNGTAPDGSIENGFKAQWEEYLIDVAAGSRHRFDLASGARGVQLAQLGLLSAEQGRRINVPEITVEA